MKSFFFLATALLSSAALAQDTTAGSGAGGGGQAGNILPKCAQPCALKAIQDSKCGSEDPACVCKAPGFAQSYVSCVDSSCSSSDAAAAISAGIRLCEAGGVTITSVSGLPASTAPPIVPPVVPSSEAPVTTPIAPTPPTAPTAPTGPAGSVPATPVPTAGANTVSAALGLVWGSMMFLFAMM